MSDGYLRADGLCTPQQNGSRFQWRVLDASDTPVDIGMTNCDLSGFAVETQLPENLECNKSYKLEAQLGLGNKALMNLILQCPGSGS